MMEHANAVHVTQEYLAENISHRLLIIASVFIPLEIVFFVLFYVSRYLAKTLKGWDVWLLIPAGFLFNIGLCVCSILAVHLGGAGRHVESVRLEDPMKVVIRTKIQKASELIDFAAITGSKLAVLVLYLRIFSLPRYRIATWVTGAIVIITWLGALIGSLTICKPLAYQWDKDIPGGHCGNLIRGYQIIAFPNLLSDVIMMVLPLPAIWKLQMGVAVKIGLALTFLFGSAGTITCILRIVTFFHSNTLLTDPTYTCITTFSYLIAEAGTYFIAACIPHLRFLKRRLFPEQSFTKLVDTGIKKLPGKGETAGGSGSGTGSRSRKGDGVLKTTHISVVESRIRDEVDPGVDEFEMQNRRQSRKSVGFANV
ncbi:hypothetical protein P280DRAFT_463091 [Massarina eburnea CBS 473.64]|uniref:Rhodopsin domain-containing protein n=1 Tax=Massarina eburnea CBS 473.64 TaxID=1395130 RepID=A0A6A6RHL9_9PLEO|nr:hypothetical protein P280DRAFT_463091 [Massarina eburnea CBS 473.64]